MGSGSKSKVYTSYRWLYKKYIVERLTEEEIAKLAGVEQSTINRWLKKYELTKKKS